MVIRTVLKVREGKSALFVCRILDGRPERKGILSELDRGGIRRDVIRFGGGGWHGSLPGFFSSLCAGRIDVDRAGTRDPFQFSLHPERNPVLEAKASPQTIRRLSQPRRDGASGKRGKLFPLVEDTSSRFSRGSGPRRASGQEGTKDKSSLVISPILA